MEEQGKTASEKLRKVLSEFTETIKERVEKFNTKPGKKEQVRESYNKEAGEGWSQHKIR